MANLPALTDEQLDLIKSTIAKNATTDELKLFLYRCKELGLDPLKPGQIFFIKYGTGPGTIVIGRDGFRAKAASTGLHRGTKVGIIRDDKGICIGAWAEVYRKDWTEPAREEVSLAEYTTGRQQWAKMPTTMIKKVAEVAALRMAFPEHLSGMYSQEEMDQASPIKDAVQVSDPCAEGIAAAKAEAKAITVPVKTIKQVVSEKGPTLQQALKEDQERDELEGIDMEGFQAPDWDDTPPAEEWPSIRSAFKVPKGVKTKMPAGDYVAQCGRVGGPIIGRKLQDIDPADLRGFVKFILTEAKPDFRKQTLVEEFLYYAQELIAAQGG